MSANTRDLAVESQLIQDTDVIAYTVDTEGDTLTYDSSPYTWKNVLKLLFSFTKMFGEKNRRKGATKINGSDISLTGTITSSGTAVTGSGTAFLTELAAGDFIVATAGEYREVSSITNNTSLTLKTAFTVDIASGQSYSRMQFLAERLDGFRTNGGLVGGIKFNSVSLPPTVSAGTYDVSGKNIIKTADDTLALTDTIQQSRQALDSFCQYLICMDSTGATKYILYGENQVATGTITSITGAGTTKTITFATGSSASAANKILVIYGNDGVNGVFKIASDTSNTIKTFESVATVTGGASGTWVIYDRINTLHGTGSATSITTDASVIKYTPSYGENGWSSSFVAFDPAKNGYYLTLSGLTDYRVLGNFRTDTTPEVQINVISHKTGRNKNDNYFKFSAVASQVTNAIRWTNHILMFGNDYKFVDDGSIGSELTLMRSGVVSATFRVIANAGAGQSVLLGASTNTISSSNSDQFYCSTSSGGGHTVECSISHYGFSGEVLKPLSGSLLTGDATTKLAGYIEV